MLEGKEVGGFPCDALSSGPVQLQYTWYQVLMDFHFKNTRRKVRKKMLTVQTGIIPKRCLDC